MTKSSYAHQKHIKLLYLTATALATGLFLSIPSIFSGFTVFSSIRIILFTIYSLIINAILLNKSKLLSKSITGKIFSIIFGAQIVAGLLISSAFFVHQTIFIPHPAYSPVEIFFSNKAFLRFFLFLSALLILGGGYCSSICFLGAWESGNAISSKNLKYYSGIFFVFAILILIILSNTPLAVIIGTIFFFITLITTGIFSVIKNKRYNCSFLCPVSSVLWIFNKTSPFKVKLIKEDGFICNNGCTNEPELSICTKCTTCINDGNSVMTFFGKESSALEIYTSTLVVLHVVFLAFYRY